MPHSMIDWLGAMELLRREKLENPARYLSEYEEYEAVPVSGRYVDDFEKAVIILTNLGCIKQAEYLQSHIDHLKE